MRALAPFLLAALASAPTPPPEEERPNVVLFVVDDLGWQDASLPFHTEPTAFNERYHTPTSSGWRRAGSGSPNAYASAPVCTPTRTSL